MSVVVGPRSDAPATTDAAATTEPVVQSDAPARRRRSPWTLVDKPPFRADVQGLRAVAVGLVVLDHAGIGLFSGGYIGVDVFFVVSGFLITGLLLAEAGTDRRIDITKFYARRARRILPMSTVVIVTTMLLSVQVLNFLRARSAITDGIWATFFAANVHFAREGTNYFASTQPPSPLQHFWSLAVEEQFYLVWPALLSLTLFWRTPRRRTARAASAASGARATTRRGRLLRGRVALVLGVAAAVSLYVSIRTTPSNPAGAYFSTAARVWEIAFGALCATLLPLLRDLPARVRVAMTWLGLGGIVLAAVSFDPTTLFPGRAALLPVLATCAVVVGGAGDPAGGANRLLAVRPMRFVGDISYSLYLWHWPLLVLAAARAGHALPVWQNLAIVAFAVVLSTLTYDHVENPFRRSKVFPDGRPRRSLVLWPVAIGSVLVVGLLVAPETPSYLAAASGSRGPRGPHDAVAAVRAAVDAGQRAEPIPAALSPPIDQVEADFRGEGACSAYGGKTSSRVCEFGSPTTGKRMTVIGNSHSAMWIPGLSVVAKQAGWSFQPLVKEACSYPDYAGPGARGRCKEWYAWALDQVRRMRPDVTAVSVYAKAGWEPGVRQMLQDLKATGTRVVLLSDAPGTTGENAADCLLRDGATQQTCLFPERQILVDQLVNARAMAREVGVDFVDVEPWFCDRRLCPMVIDSTVPYADNGHVTATYARYLAPELLRGLRIG